MHSANVQVATAVEVAFLEFFRNDKNQVIATQKLGWSVCSTKSQQPEIRSRYTRFTVPSPTTYKYVVRKTHFFICEKERSVNEKNATE